MKIRPVLIFVGAVLACSVAGEIAGIIGVLACDRVDRAGELQMDSPVVYKGLLYACGLYAPFLALTLITAAVRSIPGRGLPAILSYLILVVYMFVYEMFFGRGMEIESRTSYFAVLFAPVIVLVAAGQLVAIVRLRRAASPPA